MIKHIMKDGTIRDSMEGVVIPTTGETKAVYHIIFNNYKKQQENGSKNEPKERVAL